MPQNQREAVLALGATRWEMIRMGVLRNARIGIVGGIILGLGRALGETMAVTMVIGNRPQIAKSLFAPGYTMASVIANEFSEATGDLVSQRAGGDWLGAVHCDADRERAGPPAGLEHHRRNCEGQCLTHVPAGTAASSVCGAASPIRARPAFAILAAILVLVPLLAIFIYLVIKGVGSHQLAFLTQTPKPPGEVGGGMANAIVGTGLILAMASVIGMPLGIGSGIYLAEYGRNRFGDLIRFTADVLNGVPSIVIGIAVYSLIVVRQKHFSALSGGVALGIMMIPTVARATEEMLLMVPNVDPRGGLRAWAFRSGERRFRSRCELLPRA